MFSLLQGTVSTLPAYAEMRVSKFLVWFKVRRLLEVDHTSPIEKALDEIQWWKEETVIKYGLNLVEQ